MSIREKFTEDLKKAMFAKDEMKVHTLRLIIAAMKHKDIEARTETSREGIKDDQIMALMQSMIKQRQESIKMYLQGNRKDLSDKEQAEINIIEQYLPKQLSDSELSTIIQQTIAELGASSVKDMGKVMAELKSKYTGQIDFSKAGGLVKEKLAG